MTDQIEDTAARNAESDLPDVNPLEMKLVWDTMDKPTYTAVAEHFSALGRPLRGSRVEYWRKREWGTTDEENQRDLGDRMMRHGLKDNFTPEDEMIVNMAIMSSNDANLLRSVTRATMAASIKASLALARKSNRLAEVMPQNMGAGIQRSAAAIPQAVCGLDRLALIDQRSIQAKGAAIAAGEDAKDVAVIESEDPLAAEIAAFKRAARGQSLQ